MVQRLESTYPRGGHSFCHWSGKSHTPRDINYIREHNYGARVPGAALWDGEARAVSGPHTPGGAACPPCGRRRVWGNEDPARPQVPTEVLRGLKEHSDLTGQQSGI